jgi:peptide deformylase
LKKYVKLAICVEKIRKNSIKNKKIRKSVMSQVLPLVIAPNKILNTKAEPITVVTPEIKEIADNMLFTLGQESLGIGLAGNQVGVLKQIIAIDVRRFFSEILQQITISALPNALSIEKQLAPFSKPIILLNPKIVSSFGEMIEYTEGCLSFPGISLKIKRPKGIEVQYKDLDEKEHKLTLPGGILSICLQHEIDHINGIVFLDRVSSLKREFAIKKLQKYHKTSQTTE